MIFRRGSTSERTSTVPTVAEAKERVDVNRWSGRTCIKRSKNERLRNEAKVLTEERVEEEVILGRNNGDVPEVRVEVLEDTDSLSVRKSSKREKGQGRLSAFRSAKKVIQSRSKARE